MMDFPSAIQSIQPYSLRIKKKMKVWFQLVYRVLLFRFCCLLCTFSLPPTPQNAEKYYSSCLDGALNCILLSYSANNAPVIRTANYTTLKFVVQVCKHYLHCKFLWTTCTTVVENCCLNNWCPNKKAFCPSYVSIIQIVKLQYCVMLANLCYRTP